MIRLTTYLYSILFLVGCSNNKAINTNECYKKYISLDIEQLKFTKIKIEEKKDIETTTFYNNLISKANNILTNKYNYTITKKIIIPPSNDVHDYISMAIYRWPNPNTKDGLPYIVKDGEINPESKTKYTDSTVLTKVCKDIKTLSLAYFYSRNNKYVKRAVEILQTFFINSETRMNPNLNYGQLVPGLNMGRSAGIIESSQLSDVLEGITLLSESDEWPKSTDVEIRKWFRNYLDWLTTSKFGIEARNLRNNHGTNYDKLCCSIYLFLGEYDYAAKHINQYTKKRLITQIKKDGMQPLEVGRTKSWNYTTMNCITFIQLAIMGERVGIDLWYNKENDINHLKAMIDWFIPYVTGEKSWEWKQIKKNSITKIKWPFEMAHKHYKETKYTDAINKFHTIHKNIVF